MKRTKNRRRPRVLVLLAGTVALACICLTGIGVLLSGGDGPMPTPRLSPPTPTPYTAYLYCPDCADAGMPINLWERGQADRGRQIALGFHGDQVLVLDRQREPVEERDYLRVRVVGSGVSGWVPEPFVVPAE